ncbi:MAG: DUF4399 domain-containing protein [Chloroflexota bacterium]|nr:DUF4399 domain-containing protein [Chloroflexota bacterium]
MSNRTLSNRTLMTIVVTVAIAAVFVVMIFGVRVAKAAPAAIACPSGEVITVTAPSASAPTTVSVTVAPLVNLKPAKDAVADSFHLHYFVDIDPSTVVQAGQAVPTGNPKIIHSATTTQDVGALAAGKHSVWVVLGDVNHTTCTPMVVGSVSFDVAAAASLPASGTGADDGSTGLPWAATLVAVLIAGVAAASGGFVLRRD